MEINRLRSIIKEAVNSYDLKEIEATAENAAMEAKLEAYDKAIKQCEAKIDMAESLEEMKDLVEPARLNELKKHLKNLQKSKEKLEKVKAKKNKGKEVVTDEPMDESYVEEMNMDKNATAPEMKDTMEEEAINESFLKMQKLAGVITESQYKERLSEDNLEVKSIAKKLYSFLKQNGVAAMLLTTQNVNFKQIGIKDPKQQEATIYVFDDPSTKQTIIRVSLRGKESIVKDVENKLLTAYPGLEEFNKQQYKLYSGGLTNPQEILGAINLTFDLKEKTTAKGGLTKNQLNEGEYSDWWAKANEELELDFDDDIYSYVDSYDEPWQGKFAKKIINIDASNYENFKKQVKQIYNKTNPS